MKILMFSHYYFPHKGGVETHLEHLLKVLVNRGHEITVITEQFNPDISLSEKINRVQVIRIPYFVCGSKRMMWTWMNENEDIIDSHQLVHIHDVYWWYWPMRIIKLFKPVYITFHGYEGVNKPTCRAIIQRKIAEEVSYGSICIGDFMKKWYKASPEIVSYGAGLLQRSRKIPNNSAIFIGRYDLDTGIDMYVKGFDILPNLKSLVCYGDGPMFNTIIKVENNNVFHRGWSSQAPNYIQNYRFVFVSRYLSILEGMQVGRLVVAVYNNEIKRDYLMCHPMHDNMIIAGSVDELVKKMNYIMKHPEIEKKMVDRAYNWAKEQTWEKLADQYETLWQK